MTQFFRNILIVLFSLFFCRVAVAQNADQSFLAIADIHFTPFAACVGKFMPCVALDELMHADVQNWQSIFEKYDQAPTQYRQDTNYPLLKISMDKFKQMQTTAHPRFVLVLGDFLAHDFRQMYIKYSSDKTGKDYPQFVKKTLQFITQQFGQAFPSNDVYCIVGNNDSDKNDYYTTPSFFKLIAADWASLIKNPQNRLHFLEQFPNGGYYSVVVPNEPKSRILVLNTVVFSRNALGSNISEAAAQELSWLNSQLKLSAAQQQKVILVAHIPMDLPMDLPVHSLLSFFGWDEITFWKTKYTAAFNKIIKQYPNTITSILTGHLHMDGYANIELNNQKIIPLIRITAISPVFGNHPGFKLFSYNPQTFEITNFVNYSYVLHYSAPDLMWWREEYNFRGQYQMRCPQCRVVDGIKFLSQK